MLHEGTDGLVDEMSVCAEPCASRGCLPEMLCNFLDLALPRTLKDLDRGAGKRYCAPIPCFLFHPISTSTSTSSSPSPRGAVGGEGRGGGKLAKGSGTERNSDAVSEGAIRGGVGCRIIGELERNAVCSGCLFGDSSANKALVERSKGMTVYG